MENSPRYFGVNLYVKNFDQSFDDAKLFSVFTQYGTIISAKVMRHEDGTSKGFGFVCFSNSGEASDAIRGLNGCVVTNKPLYVSLYQEKQKRQEKLSSLHAEYERYKPTAADHSTAQTRLRGLAREKPRGMLRAGRYLAPCHELPPTVPRGRGRLVDENVGNERMQMRQPFMCEPQFNHISIQNMGFDGMSQLNLHGPLASYLAEAPLATNHISIQNMGFDEMSRSNLCGPLTSYLAEAPLEPS